MLCATCKTEISSTFKYAMTQNVCPACGGSLMDEETLALIENIKNTIAGEATLREETVHKLAMALLAQYDIAFRRNIPQNQVVSQPRAPAAPAPVEQPPKVAPPSGMRQIEQQNVITAEEVNVEGITEEEREKIMEDAVRKRYAVVDQVQSATLIEGEGEGGGPGALFSEGDVNPVLEQERLARLAKQKSAMTGGGKSAFRRSG